MSVIKQKILISPSELLDAVYTANVISLESQLKTIDDRFDDNISMLYFPLTGFTQSDMNEEFKESKQEFDIEAIVMNIARISIDDLISPISISEDREELLHNLFSFSDHAQISSKDMEQTLSYWHEICLENMEELIKNPNKVAELLWSGIFSLLVYLGFMLLVYLLKSLCKRLEINKLQSAKVLKSIYIDIVVILRCLDRGNNQIQQLSECSNIPTSMLKKYLDYFRQKGFIKLEGRIYSFSDN